LSRRLAILGATGSIGRSTLDVVARHPHDFTVDTLAANRDVDGMAALCARFRPARAVLADGDAAGALRRRLAEDGHTGTDVLDGAAALVQVASDDRADTVVAAIVGAAGLPSALAAARSGKRILLANKEALVVAGPLFIEAVEQGGAELVPVDSEHNALFQCLPAGFVRGDADRVGVRRLLLTASGGPFRTWPMDRLEDVTPEQACRHPNWSMGRKISVDSATMMNKGLELIEACWLFGMEPDAVRVVIHPQSIVHSLVEYVDGSVLAEMGNPDMRTPLAHALGLPARIESGVEPLDLFTVARLDFEAPEPARFPCLGLAAAAMAAGGTVPAVLNAANEVAVAAFLEGGIGFTAIARVISTVLDRMGGARQVASLDALMDADREARVLAGEVVARNGGSATCK